MTEPIAGTLLLDPEVIDDPYPFYGQLRAQAPVWEIPGTGLFTVSSFELVAEATGRPGRPARGLLVESQVPALPGRRRPALPPVLR
jgi:hypothetical protein